VRSVGPFGEDDRAEGVLAFVRRAAAGHEDNALAALEAAEDGAHIDGSEGVVYDGDDAVGVNRAVGEGDLDAVAGAERGEAGEDPGAAKVFEVCSEEGAAAGAGQSGVRRVPADGDDVLGDIEPAVGIEAEAADGSAVDADGRDGERCDIDRAGRRGRDRLAGIFAVALNGALDSGDEPVIDPVGKAGEGIAADVTQRGCEGGRIWRFSRCGPGGRVHAGSERRQEDEGSSARGPGHHKEESTRGAAAERRGMPCGLIQWSRFAACRR